MVFTLRKFQEKCIKQHMDLNAIFISLTKTFDTVNKEAPWVILMKFGWSWKFSQIIWCFYNGMIGLILSSGDTSAPFDTSNGVEQACVPFPVFFNLFLMCTLNYTLHESTRGVYLRYRLDSSLFDLRWLHARTRALKKLIMEALITDDCTLMAHSEHELQTIISRFIEASRLFVLTISDMYIL